MKKVLSFILILAAVILTACGGDGSSIETGLDSIPAEYAGKTNPLGADAASACAEIFKANCAQCHGEKGYGDGEVGKMLDPKPKNLAELQIIAGDDYLYWRISTGKDGTSMVAWKYAFTDEQIWQVVAFIRTLKP